MKWKCYWDIFAIVNSFLFCCHNWKLASNIIYSTDTPHTDRPVLVSFVCFAFTIAFYVRAAHLFFRFGFLYNIVYCCYSPPTLRPTINGLLRNQITNKHSLGKTIFHKSNTNKSDNYEKILPMPPQYSLLIRNTYNEYKTRMKATFGMPIVLYPQIFPIIQSHIYIYVYIMVLKIRSNFDWHW